MTAVNSGEPPALKKKKSFQDRYIDKVIQWELSHLQNEGFFARNYNKCSAVIWPFFAPLQASTPKEYSNQQILHYVSFWSMGGVMGGIGIGVLSFLKRRRYRRWVIQQPKDVQIKILAEQNVLAQNASAEQLSVKNLKTSEYISSRFSTLPKSMDTRIHLNYSGEYRPSFWFESGPLKYWNQSSFYPWASELLLQSGTWAIRLGLMAFFTLSMEAVVCKYFGYALGTNVLLRGGAGTISGFLIAHIASEGSLVWYHIAAMALGTGCAWAIATYMDPNFCSYNTAVDNYVVTGLLIPEFNEAFERRDSAQKRSKELAAKQIKDRWFAIHALKEENPKQFAELSGFDALLSTLSWEYVQLKLAKKGILISEEIEHMPFEERDKLATVAEGQKVGINYDQFPWTYLKKTKPQWFTYTMDEISEENVSSMMQSSSDLDLSTHDLNTNDPTLLQ